MKKINVEIVGMTPLLMNNPKSMLVKESVKSRLQNPDPKDEAEEKSYKNKEGGLVVPAEALFSSILNGASFKKAGKYSARSILAGNMRIEPNEVVLLDRRDKPLKEYEIDVRTVVISQGKKRNRIIRARPRIDDWRLKFSIVYNDEFIGDKKIIEECLVDAGSRIGLLDFRPQMNGSFGTFKISKFEEAKGG